MDTEAMLAYPLGVVFGHLRAPARLGDWLPAVAHDDVTTPNQWPAVAAAPPAGLPGEGA